MFLDHHPRPHAVQKLVLGDKSASRLDQSDENIEGPASNRDGLPIREKLAAVRVESKAAKFYHFRAPNHAAKRFPMIFLENLRFLVANWGVNTTRRGGQRYRIWPEAE